MSARLTLDDYAIAPDWPSEIRTLAELSGASGFTADDLKMYADLHHLPRPANPGSFLGSLVQRGTLACLGDEPSLFRSSKGRRVRRFVLAIQGSSTE